MCAQLSGQMRHSGPTECLVVALEEVNSLNSLTVSKQYIYTYETNIVFLLPLCFKSLPHNYELKAFNKSLSIDIEETA